MPAFTPDLARRFGAPAMEQRLAAAERAGAAAPPTTAEEDWRYSRIGELDLERFHPDRPATTVDATPGLWVASGELAAGDLELDLDAPDLFAELNTAFMTPVVLRIPKGVVVEQPIVVTHTVPGGGAAVFPRLIVDAGPDSEATVVERFVSVASPGATPAASLVVPLLYVHAGAAARVRYLALNELDETVWQIGHQRAVGERDSTSLLATVALGGDYARVRTEVRVSGAGASTRQVALYFAGGDQMHDFRTVQDHDAPHTTSDLLFKGAVQDRARSVYTGLIRIRKHARGTAAFQTNRNLTLSEGAWAESVPNLDIETNDVRCSHASTIGPIDEDQRFYLESRGVPPDVAERLVVLGFFDEVLDQLPGGELVAGLRHRIATKLHATAAVAGAPA